MPVGVCGVLETSIRATEIRFGAVLQEALLGGDEDEGKGTNLKARSFFSRIRAVGPLGPPVGPCGM